MIRTFSDLFTIPEPVDEFQVSRVRLLHRLLLAIICISAPFTLLLLMLPANRTINAISSLLVLLAHVGLWQMTRRGRVRVATRLFLGLWLLVPAVVAYMFSGIFSPFLYMYGLVILATALLLGERESVWAAGASIAVVTLLLLFTSNRADLIFTTGASTLQQAIITWVMLCSAFVLMSLLIVYTAHSVRRAMFKLRESESELRERYGDLATEIAERRAMEAKLRSSEERFRQIFDLAPYGMVVFGEDGYAIVVNEAFSYLMEGDSKQMAHRYVMDWFTENDRDSNQMMFSQVFEMGSVAVNHTTQLLTYNGERVPIRMMVSPVRDVNGDALYGIAIVEDLSSVEEAERKRIELQVEQEKVAFLRDFVSQMSHDLKTPLTSITTSVFLIRRMQDDASRDRYLSVIEEQARHQVEMIENLLTVARLDHLPELDRAPLNVNTLSQKIYDRLEPVAVQKGQTFRMNMADTLPDVLADATELQRALQNLVSNAIKYTPEGGTITVRTVLDNDHIVFTVADTGVGISPEDLPHVFERFYRTNNTRHSHKGTGLGLSIVRQIVELH
ncbi:MAG: ATP-binding protein, partial [Chloroflexota bacterium]